MKKLLIFFILIPILLISCSKKITETNTDAVKNNLEKLKPFIIKSAVIKYEDITYNEKEIQEMITLSNNILNNIKSFNSLKNKYKDIIRYNIRLDIFAILMIKYINNKEEDYTNYVIDFVDFYISELVSLENNNIDIIRFLENYKKDECPECDYTESVFALSNLAAYINQKQKDNKIYKNIIYDITLGWYINYNDKNNIKRYEYWNNIFNDKKLFKNKDFEKINNLLNNYKRMKAAENIENSDKYILLFSTDFINGMASIAGKKYKTATMDNIIEERKSNLKIACLNEKYMTEITIEECINLIENSKSKQEALSYVENKNIKDYYFINNNICMTDINNKEKFYKNESQVCSAIKNKLKDLK